MVLFTQDLPVEEAIISGKKTVTRSRNHWWGKRFPRSWVFRIFRCPALMLHTNTRNPFTLFLRTCTLIFTKWTLKNVIRCLQSVLFIQGHLSEILIYINWKRRKMWKKFMDFEFFLFGKQPPYWKSISKLKTLKLPNHFSISQTHPYVQLHHSLPYHPN